LSSGAAIGLAAGHRRSSRRAIAAEDARVDHGDTAGRPYELGQAIGRFTAEVGSWSDEQLVAVCGEPRTGAQMMPVIFKRVLDAQQTLFAMGETLSHINYLHRRGQLAKDLEDKTFAMKVGEVSDAIRTKQGFVLLKVREHTPAGIATLKEAEPKIQDALYYEKLQPALRTYLTKLREDAYIEIKPGYVDSGASPNQTKFVQTKGVEASAKELKKNKKLGLFRGGKS